MEAYPQSQPIPLPSPPSLLTSLPSYSSHSFHQTHNKALQCPLTRAKAVTLTVSSSRTHGASATILTGSAASPSIHISRLGTSPSPLPSLTTPQSHEPQL